MKRQNMQLSRLCKYNYGTISNYSSGKTCCWYKEKPVHDIIIPMTNLKAVQQTVDLPHEGNMQLLIRTPIDKYKIGQMRYGDSGQLMDVYATGDTVEKMRNHERGHEADFKNLFNNTIQKAIQRAEKHVGSDKAFKIDGLEPEKCFLGLYRYTELDSEVTNFISQFGKINKGRDRIQPGGDFDYPGKGLPKDATEIRFMIRW